MNTSPLGETVFLLKEDVRTLASSFTFMLQCLARFLQPLCPHPEGNRLIRKPLQTITVPSLPCGLSAKNYHYLHTRETRYTAV
jgi:hypothetical protein